VQHLASSKAGHEAPRRGWIGVLKDICRWCNKGTEPSNHVEGKYQNKSQEEGKLGSNRTRFGQGPSMEEGRDEKAGL